MAQVETAKPSPGLPAPRTIFTVIYKTGYMLNKQQFWSTDLDTAIRLGQDWAKLMNFKFINVAPFVVDLDQAIEHQKAKLSA